MTYTTEILDQESGIQYQGVKDKSGSTGAFPVIGLITGTFRRGRFDKPMTITNANIRAMLGYEPDNPAYIAVQDALAQGVPSVQVVRIASGMDYEEPTQPELPPEDEVIPEPIAEGQLKPEDIIGNNWSVLTFDEYGAVNPTYTRNNPVLGQVTVTTHASFQGQQIILLGSGAYSMLGSSPLQGQPLSFDTASGFYVEIKQDGANPDTPVLAGSVNFDTPISVLFSKDVHAVALTGGFFDNIESTYIEVYDRLGNVLGSALNTGIGIEEFGFSMGSEAKIAGFSFYVNDYEGSGFAIDNLKFQ